MHNKRAPLIDAVVHRMSQISGYGMNPLLRAVDSLKSALRPRGQNFGTAFERSDMESGYCADDFSLAANQKDLM
jgi:hypothetical protein